MDNETPRVVPAIGRAYDLHERLRQSDVQELAASAPGQSVEDVLKEAVEISHLAWACWRLGQVQALFGVAPIIPEEMGSIWLLASDDIYNFKTEFMEYCVHYLEVMHRFYPILGNFVDNRNTTARKWIKNLGFQEGDEIDCAGHPFTYFWSDTRNV